MSRYRVMTDEQWARVEPLLPWTVGTVARPFHDHRTVAEGLAYRRPHRYPVAGSVRPRPGDRDDKHPVTFRAGTLLAAVITWLRR